MADLFRNRFLRDALIVDHQWALLGQTGHSNPFNPPWLPRLARSIRLANDVAKRP